MKPGGQTGGCQATAAGRAGTGGYRLACLMNRRHAAGL